MFAIINKLLDRPLNEEKFADLVLDMLRRTWPAHTFTLEKEKFQITQSGGMMINLHNIYLDYRSAEPALRKEQLDRFVGGIVVVDDQEFSYEDVQERLLPVLRSLSGADLMRIDAGDEKALSEVLEFLPLSEEIGIALAIDSELSIRQLGGGDLARWGKTFDEVLQVGIGNLRHLAAASFRELDRGLFASEYGDYYDAPRMLVQELIWQLPVGANPVVMVPNRNCLFVCRAEDTGALDHMIEHARSILFEESRPLSAEMFKLTETTWTPWIPLGESGLKLRRLQREFTASGYAEQKEALDTLHDQVDKDIFVATQTLVERPVDGQLVSYCVLTKGVHTWLPKADLVCLIEEPDAASVIVTMTDFLSIAGSFAKRLPYVLPRYEIVEFPGEECMAILRERATGVNAISV